MNTFALLAISAFITIGLIAVEASHYPVPEKTSLFELVLVRILQLTAWGYVTCGLYAMYMIVVNFVF